MPTELLFPVLPQCACRIIYIYRQQREEIRMKQEKLESMLRKKKDPGLRPESPSGRRKRRRPHLAGRRLPGVRSSEVGITMMFHIIFSPLCFAVVVCERLESNTNESNTNGWLYVPSCCTV